MREPEFLPRWYQQLINRRRALTAQVCATAAVTAALALWAIYGLRQIQTADGALSHVTAQLVATGADLQRLNDLSTIQRQLEKQDQIVRDLGTHVPVSRMLTALQQLMPPRMALEELTLKTSESAAPLTEAQRAKGETAKISRKLLLDLQGVAPSQDELATFLTDLVAVPFFSEVELVKAEERSDKSHLMRGFEVKFALDLDGDPARPGTVASAAPEGSGLP